MSAVTKEAAIVYRAAGRRFLTQRAAVKAAAVERIRAKYPTDKPEYTRDGAPLAPGWYWTELPRSDVLLRRMCRVIKSAMAAREVTGETKP
jgi:hypothetical protein